MGGDGWDDASLDPKAADGSYFTTHYRPDDPRPEAQAFVKAYRAKYSDAPSFAAALSYDTANLLLTAIRDAGVDNTDAVRAALEKISFVGVTGTIAMNARHTPLKGVVVEHVTGGVASTRIFRPDRSQGETYESRTVFPPVTWTIVALFTALC